MKTVNYWEIFVNNLVKYGMLAVYVGAGAMVASPAVLAESNQQMSDEIQQLQAQLRALQDKVSASGNVATPAPVAPAVAPDSTVVTAKGGTVNLGGLKLTLGGFIAGESIWRSRNETADIASSFTAYPFANNNNYYDTEFRESGRQSRLSLLVQGPVDGPNKVEGFVASDFLSSGVTSNSNESNSYTMRIREAYATWARSDANFYVLAGQTWSLATMYKQGLKPRSEDIPLTIDAQYVVGFNWLRNPEVRYVQNFGDLAALGIALESPQGLIKGTAPAGALANNTGGSLLNNGEASGATSNLVNYSTDIAPDVIVKAALDPGWGHYEVYSLTRFFRDRSEATPGTLNSETNHTTVAESIGAGAIVPVLPKLIDFQASGLIGHGNGRYGSSTLGDATYNTNNGSLAALKEEQLLLGLVAHPTSRLDLYTYAGMEHLGSAYAYGAGTGNEAGCQTNYADGTQTGAGVITAPSCSGTVATTREVTGGLWWKFYKGPIGYLTAGAQGEFNKVSTYTDAKGFRGKTDDSTVMLSFRYYPYQ